MGNYIGDIKERLYGVIVSFLVIVLSFYSSKIGIFSKMEVVFYGGIFLVIGGFLSSALKNDTIKFGQTIIVGGIITMFLGYLF